MVLVLLFYLMTLRSSGGGEVRNLPCCRHHCIVCARTFSIFFLFVFIFCSHPYSISATELLESVQLILCVSLAMPSFSVSSKPPLIVRREL